MSQMAVRGPFAELYLGDELGPEPATVFHLLFGQCPLRAFFLGKVGEWASIRLQALELARYLLADKWHKPVSHLCRIIEFVAFIVSDNQCVKRMAGCIAANDEFL
jgi:hypothetical protein